MNKLDDLPVLSEVQLEIMNIAWEQIPCSVADIWNELSERRHVSRNTVHTLIVRLEEKGWMRRRTRNGRVTYSPTVSREQNQQHSVRRMVENVFGGSAEGLVLALLNEPSISEKDAQRIQTMIAKARGKKS